MSYICTGINASSIKEDDPLAMMGEQLLYIPESSLSHMIPIGEGRIHLIVHYNKIHVS